MFSYCFLLFYLLRFPGGGGGFAAAAWGLGALEDYVDGGERSESESGLERAGGGGGIDAAGGEGVEFAPHGGILDAGGESFR